MADQPRCDLEHQRAATAVVRVLVKSTLLHKPGHPMTRELVLCATHARKLREFGFELVWP